MPVILNLPEDLYNKMSQQAAHKGVKVEEYALNILKEQFSQKDGEKGASQFLKVVKELRLGKTFKSKSEAQRLDRELRQAVKRKQPHFQSLEQAMTWSRGYPWGTDDSN